MLQVQFNIGLKIVTNFFTNTSNFVVFMIYPECKGNIYV